MKRVGLFGGSFDPVHSAHLALARAAVNQLALDEVRWIPAGEPWQKTRRLAPADHRLAMLRLALAGEPEFVIDERELRRAGVTYTLDTVRELHAAEPDAQWFLILGRDQYARLHTWHEWRELLSRVTLAIADRPGSPVEVDPAVAQAAQTRVALPAMEVSSTEIRRRVASGEDIAAFVPAGVSGYIEQHRLYRDVSPQPHSRS